MWTRTPKGTVLTLALWLLLAGAAQAQEAEAADEETAAKQELTREADEAAQKAKLPPAARNLQDLLQLLKAQWKEERAENRERERRFLEAREQQADLLAEVEHKVDRAGALSQTLEKDFQGNEVELAQLQDTLNERLGNLGELFGVVRQVAADAQGNFQTSLTSAQLPPDRETFLQELGEKKALPSINALERLWYELQREMTEQGRVVTFEAPVLTVEGGEVPMKVTRVGTFSALTHGEYLLWEPDIHKLRELERQPPSKYVSTISSYQEAKSGLAGLAIDPSRGSLLSVLIDTRSLPERIPDGGYVGYAIIALGVIAAILAVGRLLLLWITGRKVQAQQKRSEVSTDNPLGRVLGVYEQNRNVDPETLELKLDEAVMRETTRLERFLALVKVVSVVAPLMGLLGTVTGMIRTFQSITLFGTGDPRMMAGGISEALVTTMLGLVVAIPLVLLHTALSSNTKRIVSVLDEQSAGLVARRAESRSA